MGKIDTSGWKEFSVCELFGKSRLGKYHSPESLVESETGYPYICASNQNNGINQKMSLVSGDDVRPTPQNIISWGKQCPYFTFHEEPCVTGQGMYYIVIPKYIPRRAIRYVITVLQSAVEGKFGYSDCFIGSSMDDLKIKLPSTTNGDPDWDYMESYIKSIEASVSNSLTRLQSAKDSEKKKIDTVGWKPFTVGELFDVVKGKRLTKAEMKPGNIRFIGSSASNNGCTAMIGNDKNQHSGNTITVCYNGSVGETFYQSQPFVASDDVNVLYPKFAMNQQIALFIAPLIKSASSRYDYIDKWKKEAMEADKILLPVDQNGVPDWTYMEEYMKMVQERVKDTLNQFMSA